MAPQYQVYSLPDTSQQVFTVSDGFVPASQGTLATNNNQNYNLTAWMVAQSDPEHYGRFDVYETPRGTLGPANADAEISANSTVSKDISLLDQGGSSVLLGETLMVPVADSMVYLRPLYVASSSNPQPNLQYVIAVLGKNVQIDTSLSNVLMDVFGTSVQLPSSGGSSTPSSGTGTVPAAVTGYLAAAQTQYQNALTALKAGNLAAFQTDIQAMAQQITLAQQALGQASGAATGSGSSTTPTTAPSSKKSKGSKSSTTSTTAITSGTGGGAGNSGNSGTTSSNGSSTSSTAPTSTEPAGGSTTTTSTPQVSAVRTGNGDYQG